MIPESDKKYFRDVQDIDLTSDPGMIYFLNRKIMFGKIEKQRMPEVKRLFDQLDMEEYWRSYFIVYFKKYAVN
jgi:hypothetical protein